MSWADPASTIVCRLPDGGIGGGGDSPSGQVRVLVDRGFAACGTGLVAALFAPLVALSGSARRFFLAIALLDIPLQFDQNFAYRDEAADLGAAGGFNVSLTTFALAALYVAWFIDRVVRRHPSDRVPRGLVLPLTAYVGVAALSVVVARDVGLYARGLILLVQMFLLYVYLVATVRTRQDVLFVASWLMYGLVCEAVIMAMGLAGGEGFKVAGIQTRTDTTEADFGTSARFGGTIGSPILAAAYLEMLLAPALALLGTDFRRYYKMVAILALSLGSAALVGTSSRAAWLAVSLSLTIVYFLLWRRKRLTAVVPVVLIVLLSVIALLFHENISRRLTSDDRDSARSRLPLMMVAWDIIGDGPVLGTGANNYTEALKPRTPTFGNKWLFTVHNQYLLVWAETGIAGLAAYLWFLLSTLYLGWQCWKRANLLLSPLALGFTAALMGQMLHMNVDIFNTRPQWQLLCVVAALIAAMNRITTRAQPSTVRMKAGV